MTIYTERPLNETYNQIQQDCINAAYAANIYLANGVTMIDIFRWEEEGSGLTRVLRFTWPMT